MTPDEAHVLGAVAKALTVGHIDRWASLPVHVLDAYADILQPAWDADARCSLCPRLGRKHTCGCPHSQAKKRLTHLGVWPHA